MTSFALADPPQAVARVRGLFRRRVRLSTAYWVGLGALFATILATAHPQYPESALGAGLIIAAAWLPALVWIRKGMGGLPIFPVFAATYTWTFGLPLLYEHPIVKNFDASDQLFAAFSVAGFLLLSTAIWYAVRRSKGRPPSQCLSIERSGADLIFFIIMVASIAFTIAVNGAWLNVPPGVYSIIRSVMLAVEALSCFVLSYRLGTGELAGFKSLIFKLLLVTLVLVSLPPLQMITSMALVALAALGYVSASGKIPWISFSAAILMFAFFHMGKAEMRNRYWGEADQGPVEPTAYPTFFIEWISTSIDELAAAEKGDEDEKSSLLERASLMQLLLYEQTLASSIPLLYGDTYIIVPQLLIPRIVYPDKPITHEGTSRLNIHYGFQTREQTENTTIGFGLLNEAYANFGLVGMALFAGVIGSFYALVERWAAVVPLLSFRGLFAIIVASYSFQTEFAAGVYVAALFQSIVALLGLSLFIMRLRPNQMTVPS